MTEKRFTVETSENQLIIVDNEGPDDYYHLGCDDRDVKGICRMLNDLNKDNQEEIQAFKKQNKELTQLIKTLIKENEELKDENWKLKRANQDLHHQNSRLRVFIKEHDLNLLE